VIKIITHAIAMFTDILIDSTSPLEFVLVREEKERGRRFQGGAGNLMLAVWRKTNRTPIIKILR